VFNVEMLPARYGDCILIEYGAPSNPHHILIDAGTEPTWDDLKPRLARVKRLELFVLTHVDADHIAGAIPFLDESRETDLEIGEVWFNGWPQIDDPNRQRAPVPPDRPKRDDLLSVRQGEVFSALLADPKVPRPWNTSFGGGAVQVDGEGQLPTVEFPGEMKLTILSPTPKQLGRLRKKWSTEIRRHGLIPGQHAQFRKFLAREPEHRTDSLYLADTRFRSDGSVPNASSIAFLAEYRGRAVLFSGDAVPTVLIASIKRLLAERERGEERLELDAYKVPHHGSRGNTSMKLLELLDCKRYLISCNGDVHKLPDNETIGRIIQGGGQNPELIFNYNCERTEVWATSKGRKGNPEFTATYGDEGNITVELQTRSRRR